MKKTRKIKTGQLLYVECNEAEMTYRLLVTGITKSVIKGRLDYSSSAYGDAVVTDIMERGMLISLKWSDITFVAVEKELGNRRLKPADVIAEIKDAARERKGIAKKFIKAGVNTMQKIDMLLEDDNSVSIEMTSTLSHKDREGVPVVCKCYYWIRPSISKESIDYALENRFNCVSSSGAFHPETKVVFRRAPFDITTGYLKDSSPTVMGIVPDELKESVNLFLDGARNQYGKTA